MRLIDIVNSPWALTPEKLDEIVGIYTRHVAGEKLDLAAFQASVGKPLPGPTQGYYVQNGVAIVPIDGVISKRATLMQQISGGTSLELLHRDFRAALEDRKAHAVMLLIDSPGGTTMGLQEVGDAIYAARQGAGKEVVALTDGMMASAAYWLGSAADQVFISSDTTLVGSIGVLMRHVDLSGANEKAGVKVSNIYAGKYKTMGSPDEPLSDEARGEFQTMVDKLYGLFVNTVARHRGVDAEAVLKEMAEGRVFLGREAIAAGLVDGVRTLDQLIDDLNAGRITRQR
jgi:signal peptide peptidase SppA